jgi:hypothetical protein
MNAHATKICSVCVAWLNISKPQAKTRLLARSTDLPPKRSISRPAMGPTAAATSKAAEKAPNTREYEVLVD